MPHRHTRQRLRRPAKRGTPLRMTLPAVRRIGLVSALAAAVALGVALGSETWGGLVPCALCLLERWPYRVVIVLGLLCGLLPLRWARPLLVLALLAMLASTGLAAVHVGVEQGYWPSPLPECASPRLGGGSIAARLAQMPARPAKPCDDPTFLIPAVPLSMAAMNLLYALTFSLLLAAFLWRDRRSA
jgi:disulfide bond formation protein DsbB